ncbi:30S ribosomal protein S3 [Candidatus Adlerbacteria bacterium RIFCSPHIGHO2_01_FULL_54_23]|uniref:Small ribosomal subunit protein uS3 n=4 Tax=root TaxID=1 RepID=A0A1F4Y0L9_9BACT|nr:30S ribosomal protein S3 [uncultured organism]KKW36028.1 MAG: 30S ribosomal protein S3 [Candidatus Adlerbacteria bacterium GW2011_GWA1_54_10]KKW36190.1 MAG: 30S ribosomal protein S3 [Candidatus Adlerbacteria bacterium GW2011_GWA2_54_12]KKW37324.1 MAG: 30S ribosomal protein S3 [Candidatus Adlerbacteria bacterium GW2011_GWB1_54_7]OGC78991.1 MAG: 30S ribosomal protein S3 [Candidatus Adlerbacteria bacterium RIFCSPHIGHO2_01_FULL_54_23]OGC87431.1 MAG: 30S ribosomal protein S3 [Candidatus Adlerbac
MSKVVNPFSHRLGILRDWRHRWFATGRGYQDNLKADILLREFLQKELRGMYIGGIELERSRGALRVIIKTSRPGLIIGRSGEGSMKLKNSIMRFLQKRGLNVPELRLDVEEIRSPESSAAIVAYMVAEGLEKRLPFRRVLKQTVEKVMANRDVKGVRVGISGMLGGGSMSRTEHLKKGRIPLQTLRADVDYARERANLPLGVIGIKVWIYKGDVFADKGKGSK